MFLSFVLMPTYLHRPSLSLDWSSPRNVVPPFFSMCLSMSTCRVRVRVGARVKVR
tara:strand:- start:204 stop:368 length:165 start_codon:yes stop_codon:yes gene_type:complete